MQKKSYNVNEIETKKKLKMLARELKSILKSVNQIVGFVTRWRRRDLHEGDLWSLDHVKTDEPEHEAIGVSVSDGVSVSVIHAMRAESLKRW